MFSDPTAPVQPNQYAVEFMDFLAYITDRRPRRILEIGICDGGTLYQWMIAVEQGGIICGIDSPGSAWGKPESAKPVRWQGWADKFGVKLEILLANSHDRSSFEWARERSPFDLVFIDGDHSFDGACQDFEDYSKLVIKGGIVALHDILYHPGDPLIGVYKLWQDIKTHFKTVEFLSDPYQKERGIGVCLF